MTSLPLPQPKRCGLARFRAKENAVSTSSHAVGAPSAGSSCGAAKVLPSAGASLQRQAAPARTLLPSGGSDQDENDREEPHDVSASEPHPSSWGHHGVSSVDHHVSTAPHSSAGGGRDRRLADDSDDDGSNTTPTARMDRQLRELQIEFIENRTQRELQRSEENRFYDRDGSAVARERRQLQAAQRTNAPPVVVPALSSEGKFARKYEDEKFVRDVARRAKEDAKIAQEAEEARLRAERGAAANAFLAKRAGLKSAEHIKPEAVQPRVVTRRAASGMTQRHAAHRPMGHGGGGVEAPVDDVEVDMIEEDG